MRFGDTFFGQHPMPIYGGGVHFGRKYWLHTTVEVFTGGFSPMHHKNPDGSIDVLGANVMRFRPCTIGTANRDGLQKSLKLYAEKMTELGATITKQTKNQLRIRYKNERIIIEIKYTSK